MGIFEIANSILSFLIQTAEKNRVDIENMEKDRARKLTDKELINEHKKFQKYDGSDYRANIRKEVLENEVNRRNNRF